MKKLIFLLCLLCLINNVALTQNYINNRAPLFQKPYMELPLGAIRAKGWLLTMLETQKTGSTGHMEVLYPLVMDSSNGWLGGTGDQWERGPYWIDGLLPLAYILDDEELKAKAQPWVEWALKSQKENGSFGPDKNYPAAFGQQRDNAEDWWPRMVVLKILYQYYSATNDKRVIDFFMKYFRYQLNTLPEKPLNNWTHWATYRVADNMQIVYWLYNKTGESFLLELGELLHKQSYDFTDMLLNRDDLSRLSTIHCVNLAQGIKEPIIYYQQKPDKKYIDAVKKGFDDIRKFNGQPQGMYGGDEALHGNNPTQGSELCSAVELMFSLENMTEITGDVSFADHLEKIAFNALPTQCSDDYETHQYYQQANQVMISRHIRNFDQQHGGTPTLFGIYTGYPCCASNKHQGWPKFTQHLWYATQDNGIAAMAYSPSEVTAKVADGKVVRITEETNYPMDDKIKFVVNFPTASSASFPFHVRIPGWCKTASINVNGKEIKTAAGGQVEIINRKWKNGDLLEIHLPMEIQCSRWYENSISVERGPLVYALKIEEQWNKIMFENEEKKRYGDYYWEVLPKSPWNYGIVQFNKDKTSEVFKVVTDSLKQQSSYPWNPQNAPIEIKVAARRIPQWGLYNEMAGPLPYSVSNDGVTSTGTPIEEITLIPYGCTTLRISEFPIVKRK